MSSLVNNQTRCIRFPVEEPYIYHIVAPPPGPGVRLEGLPPVLEEVPDPPKRDAAEEGTLNSNEDMAEPTDLKVIALKKREKSRISTELYTSGRLGSSALSLREGAQLSTVIADSQVTILKDEGISKYSEEEEKPGRVREKGRRGSNIPKRMAMTADSMSSNLACTPLFVARTHAPTDLNPCSVWEQKRRRKGIFRQFYCLHSSSSASPRLSPALSYDFQIGIGLVCLGVLYLDLQSIPSQRIPGKTLDGGVFSAIHAFEIDRRYHLHFDAFGLGQGSRPNHRAGHLASTGRRDPLVPMAVWFVTALVASVYFLALGRRCIHSHDPARSRLDRR
jgi:hypothetical protein